MRQRRHSPLGKDSADRIKQNKIQAGLLAPRPETARVETLPGPLNSRNYIVAPSTFDIRIGRAATDLTVPFTMTSGLVLPTYRAATPRVAPSPRPPPDMPLRLRPLSARDFQVGATTAYRFGSAR